jgi:hypothetical protein
MESSKKILSEQDKRVGDSVKPLQKISDTSTEQPEGPQTKPLTAQVDDHKSAIEDAAGEIVERTAKTYDQTKEVVSQAYQKTSQVATDTYQQAMTYGKKNPGTLTLIALGAGIGIGLVLAGSGSSRGRTSTLIEPVGKALTRMALAIFR